MDSIDLKLHTYEYVIIVLFYCFAAVSLLLDRDNYIFTIDNVYFQIVILCALCFIVNILLLLSSHHVALFIQTVLYYIILTLIIKLYAGSVSMRFWLAGTYFYTMAIKYPHRLSITLSSLFFIHLFSLQLNTRVYGLPIEQSSNTMLWLLFSGEFLLFVFSQLRRYFQDRLGVYKNDLDQKEKSINFLADTNLGFQEYAMRIENESRMEERLNITREIHDITGYTLTSILMMLEYGEDLIRSDNKEELIDVLSTARQQARKGHAEIRCALKQLRSIKEKPVPFFHRIKEIVDTFRKITDMEISLELSNMTSRIGKKYDHIVIRFLQEGLTNAFRHGKASKIKIIFFQDKQNVIISMEDNGIGSSTIVEGIGLKGMTERLKEYGGTLTYGSNHRGFSLIARLPLYEMKEST